MTYSLGILLAIVFVFLGLVHLYWAFGGRVGYSVAVPTISGRRLFNPSRISTVAVAFALFSAMLIVLGRIGVWGHGVPGSVFVSGSWILAVLFLLRAIGEFRYIGFFKQVRNTGFSRWDTWVFSPLCVAISISAVIVAGCAV